MTIQMLSFHLLAPASTKSYSPQKEATTKKKKKGDSVTVGTAQRTRTKIGCLDRHRSLWGRGMFGSDESVSRGTAKMNCCKTSIMCVIPARLDERKRGVTFTKLLGRPSLHVRGLVSEHVLLVGFSEWWW